MNYTQLQSDQIIQSYILGQLTENEVSDLLEELAHIDRHNFEGKLQ